MLTDLKMCKTKWEQQVTFHEENCIERFSIECRKHQANTLVFVLVLPRFEIKLVEWSHCFDLDFIEKCSTQNNLGILQPFIDF